MGADARHDDARAIRERIRQLKLFFLLWLLFALLYGTMFVLTFVLHSEFNGLFFAVTLAMTGGAVLDVIWIRAARRQLSAVESA